MSNLENQYLDVLQDLRAKATNELDAIGTNNRTIYPASKLWCTQVHHDLKDGLPLITSKKVWLRGLVGELVSFLAGITNVHDMRAIAGTRTSVWDEWALKEDYHTIQSRSSQECLTEFANQLGISVAKADEQIVLANERHGYPLGGMMLLEDHGIYQEQKVLYKEAGELGPIYGFQWRNFDGAKIDQLAELLTSLNANPLGRRHMVMGWNPKVTPEENESHFANIVNNKQVLPPCHYDFLCDVEIDQQGRPTLNLCFDMRSADWFVGVPFNLGFYGLLTHLIAAETRMGVGKVVGDFKNYHLYHNHLEAADTQLSRRDQVYALPQVKLQPGVSLRKIMSVPVGERLSEESIELLREQVDLIVNSVVDYYHHDKIDVDVAV